MRYRSVFRPGLFEGQTVIVTGGGSGIGRCTAHELAALGAEVVIVGRNEQKLEIVRAEIVEDGGRASAFVCDIRDEAAVIRTVDAVLVANGRIDGLVNNPLLPKSRLFAQKPAQSAFSNRLTTPTTALTRRPMQRNIPDFASLLDPSQSV